jgi:predicted TIM-barrel fold metal-dependent hydrolase
MAATPDRAVDAHAHVFSADAPAVAGARYRPSYGANVNDWRRLWEGAGITHGVVVQPSFFGTDNREMLDTIAADPEHLRGVAVLDPLVDAATLQRFTSLGVRALRLNLRGVEDYRTYATPRWRDFYERIAEFGWHAEVFVDLGRLPEVEPAFTGSAIPVVFDHFGSAGAEKRSLAATFDAVSRLASTGPVWAKMSAPYRHAGSHPRELAARWLDAVGPANVLWGSDWPWTGHEAGRDYGRLREELDDWVDPRVVRAALWDNAARLYGFT